MSESRDASHRVRGRCTEDPQKTTGGAEEDVRAGSLCGNIRASKESAVPSLYEGEGPTSLQQKEEQLEEFKIKYGCRNLLFDGATNQCFKENDLVIGNPALLLLLK